MSTNKPENVGIQLHKYSDANLRMNFNHLTFEIPNILPFLNDSYELR